MGVHNGIIESLESSEFFVLVGVIGRILDTANYLYTFTCALCWIDILLRYRHFGLFIIGNKTNNKIKSNYTSDGEEESETQF
ncbi:hypothetical protein Mgra_00004772 [Meloidogyne graminicola]|uniref:Uncharacterized protein n=1 Tax=Meloidogyne graminicola TaxID=189291 RepID=A0A8S9ZR20_9BILA|nr:hypothetical protein Mgra_00004772 [Meloidogyne graminicola]